MSYESEWDGFAAQAGSGVAEALYAAGVDCSVHEHGSDAPAAAESGSSDD